MNHTLKAKLPIERDDEYIDSDTYQVIPCGETIDEILILIPHDKYKITHGINNGIYEYVGRVINDGSFKFVNDNGDTYYRYSWHLPYEFGRECRPVN